MDAKINKLYDSQTFFDRYNGSVLISILVLFVFFIIFSYYYIQTRINPIKANWSKERCSPPVIPFAGLINLPKDKGVLEFTFENFNHCVNNIIKDAANIATEPIHAATNVVVDIYAAIGDAINDVRKILSAIRTSIEGNTRNIMSRILNMMIPIQKVLISFKSIMSRAHATMVSGMYTAIGTLWFLISGLLSVYKLIIIILIALAATIAALWAIPFGFGVPAALAFTVVFIAIAIPMIIIEVALKEVIDVTQVNHSLHGVPGLCFKKNTLIRGKNNVLYTIDSIPLGTQLAKGGGFVTAVLKLDASKQEMYQLGNVIVSGSHKVKHNKEWVYVRDHPEALLIENFEDKYIYCLNTSKKIIPVEDYIFQDWDEIDEKLLEKCGCKNTESIFNDLENGFHPETILNVVGKGKTMIREIDIGDKLTTGETIIGLVKIQNNKELVEFKEGFIGTRQFSFLQNLGIVSSSKQKSNILYHILTDKGHLHIKEQKIMDYNWNIDFFIV